MIRPAVRAMSGYAPGEQRADVVKLNTNESPYPPSPRAVRAIADALGSLRKYPQPFADDFRAAAAQTLGVTPDMILAGNGSDDVLTILTRAYVPDGGTVASLTPSYILYKTLADIQGATYVPVPFAANWQLPDAWPVPDAHLTFLANPNSPSGTVVKPADVPKLAKQLSGPLVLDEAYVEFAEWTGVPLVGRVPNLIVTRTFSKAHGLAGLRAGFCVAAPDIIRELRKVKDSYNCDTLSLAGAAAAIADREYLADVVARVRATRGRLRAELTELGFQVTPSHTNFVWCTRADRPVKPLYEALKDQDILVRYMNYAGFGDGLRISVGTDADIDTLLSALRGLLAAAGA